MSNTSRSRKMQQWWGEPTNRERVKQAKLEANARALGTTVEALQRPKVWAPMKVRVETYRDLFLEGKRHEDVVRLYPREDMGIIQRGYVLAERILLKPAPSEEEKAREARARIRSEKVKAAWTPERRAAHSKKVKEGARRAAREREDAAMAAADERERKWRERKANNTARIEFMLADLL